MKHFRSVFFFSIILALAIVSCKQSEKPVLSEIKVKWLDGNEHQAIETNDTGLKVFVFLAPECPLSINFTPTILQLADSFKKSGVNFYSVFPGEFYSKEEIKHFVNEYELNLPVLLDNKNEIAKALQASITPEAFLIDKNGEVVYSGAIDNRAYATGKKRTVATEFYLRNAISATLAGNKPSPELTEAIGCYIEY